MITHKTLADIIDEVASADPCVGKRSQADALWVRFNALVKQLDQERSQPAVTMGRCRTCRFWGKGLGPMNPYGLPVLPGNYEEPKHHGCKPRDQREHGFCTRAAVFNGTGGWQNRRSPEASSRPLMLATLAYSHESHMETRFDYGCILHEAADTVETEPNE